MAASSGGKLGFVEENMEKMQYLRILKENLKKSAEDLRLGSGFRFYQQRFETLIGNRTVLVNLELPAYCANAASVARTESH